MKNAGALNQLQSEVFGTAGDAAQRPVAAAPAVSLVRGRDAVAAMQGMLVELCRRTGQAGAMEWLDYFVSSPESMKKIPYLLLVGRHPGTDRLVNARAVTADDVQGAVLIYEYRCAGLGTRVFATDDIDGFRTVIAAREARAEVAEVAIRGLMRMGAVAALVTVAGDLDGRTGLIDEQRPAYRTALRMRTVPHHLRLAGTLEATLAMLGDDTRRNFRRYRRRAEKQLGAEFVADVQMGRAEFLEMNRRSTNPAEDAKVEWRFGLIERNGRREETLFSGVRAQDGRWLSLIGGRRHGQTTEIDWQMNLAGLPRNSLNTVMRAFLLEHEIARGTKKLVFRGGTPHPIRLSFATVEATDILAVRRWSLRAWVLRRFARWIFPRKHFLGGALRAA